MLNPYEARILIALVKRPRFWNTNEVSKTANISWSTAEKYLERMHELGWLEKKGRTKIYWKAKVQEDIQNA